MHVYLPIYTYVCMCWCFHAQVLGTRVHVCKKPRKDIGASLSWTCGFSHTPVVSPSEAWLLAPWGPRPLNLVPIQSPPHPMKNTDETSGRWSQHHLQMEKIQSNPSFFPTTRAAGSPLATQFYLFWALGPCSGTSIKRAH